MNVKNNYSISGNTNFKALNSVKWTGLYKKNPEYVRQLYDGLKKNDAAMDFFKKYDTEIVFNAEKIGFSNLIESSLRIYYKDPSHSKFRQFIKFLLEGKSFIDLSAFEYKGTLAECSNKLLQSILPNKKGNSKLKKELLKTEKNFKIGN